MTGPEDENIDAAEIADGYVDGWESDDPSIWGM